MNAMPPPEKPEVPPVFTDKMRAYYAQVESFQKAIARRHKRLSKAVLGIAVIEAMVIAGLTVALAELAPTVRIVPVFLWARPDGTVENAISPSSLPVTLNEAQQRAAVWEYVRLRESYSQVEEPYNYTVVSAMSASDVKQRYQRTHNGQYAESPVNKIGNRGAIRVSFVSSTKIGPNRYIVRFDRSVEIGDQRATITRMTAPIAFTTNAPVKDTDRITFNGSGIVVTEYPGPEAEGNL